jgi:peptidyl-prolyl cis-trans isomerase B (cyclophilin B)
MTRDASVGSAFRACEETRINSQLPKASLFEESSSGALRVAAALIMLLVPLMLTAQTSPGAGPVIVLETVKGNIEFETYPEEAPKTVAQIVGLVKRGFYNGLRFHRAEYDLVQIGDPATRNLLKKDMWGRGNSGKPIGVAEITKKRRHVRGAVAMAYPGSNAKLADSQFYITTKPHPELDAKFTVFGQVIKGMDVVDKIKVEDVLRKAYVKEGPARP